MFAIGVAPAASTNENHTNRETMQKRIAAIALASALAGCATYQIDLMPRGSGPMAHGTAKQIDKSVSIQIGDEAYDGRYAYVQGGTFSLGTISTGSQTASGSAIGISAVGNGNVLAQSASGHNLRCVFNFSGWSQAGTGTCLTDEGRVYDLQVTR